MVKVKEDFRVMSQRCQEQLSGKKKPFGALNSNEGEYGKTGPSEMFT
jgi:hypothetical protein